MLPYDYFVPRNDIGALVAELFYHIYRVFHIIKRDVRHNTMTQIEYEAILTFHPVEQTVNTFFDHFFISIQNMRIKVALYCYAFR